MPEAMELGLDMFHDIIEEFSTPMAGRDSTAAEEEEAEEDTIQGEGGLKLSVSRYRWVFAAQTDSYWRAR